MPVRQVRVNLPLVRRLLRSQLPPELSHLVEAPLRALGPGWDNVAVRLGDDLVVRVPKRRAAADLAANEVVWVETASAPIRDLGIAAPIPLFAAEPGRLVPWTWTIVPWIPGEDVFRLPIQDRDGLVEPLARALVALHRPAPREAPANPYRGVPLAERARAVSDRWPAMARWLGREREAFLRGEWERALAAPGWPGPPLWFHGDLHPLNLIQQSGRLVGMIDFGDIGAGDPAVDLATAWLTFGPEQRERFWSVVLAEGSYDDAIRARAAGWAVVIYSAFVADPITRRNLAPLLDDIRDQMG